ncbi:DNA repair protein RecO [Alteromonas lipotrueiana]|uniref:DNA repair protein RecO n=1 Tax=Alteromonas lipotrueiana TaxID=2803815 RepID=UPI001C444492|nr:DNA repair protein RecO [Alteromonas lipotrueiana]
MKSLWQTAFVLHRRAYRETSYLVDFFTRDAGIVTAVAKGVKNSKSDRKSLLQPFARINVQLAGRSELKNLAQVESSAAMLFLQGKNLFCALYVNELLSRVLPKGLACEELFDHYQTTLHALAGDAPPDVALRDFEFALLEEMGQLPDLLNDAATGEPVTKEHWYQFVQELGIVRASKPGQSRSVPGTALLSMHHRDWDSPARQAAKLIARQALLPLLGDKPLKSRELFR